MLTVQKNQVEEKKEKHLSIEVQKELNSITGR